MILIQVQIIKLLDIPTIIMMIILVVKLLKKILIVITKIINIKVWKIFIKKIV